MSTINNFLEEKKATPGDINQHLDTLKKYASECESLVEFGVGRIVSTWALLAGKPKRMVSYDINDPIVHGSNIQIVYSACKEEGIEYDFIKDSTLNAKIAECDLLFIDSLHTYKQLSEELKLHGDLVKKYIIFHDTETFGAIGEDGSRPGLKQAITDFLDIKKDWSIDFHATYNNGLTVLKRIKHIQ
jgi:hypothetical protein